VSISVTTPERIGIPCFFLGRLHTTMKSLIHLSGVRQDVFKFHVARQLIIPFVKFQNASSAPRCMENNVDSSLLP